MLAFLFPGQGSQYLGMGRELFDRVPEYAAVEREIDRLLGYSVREVCLTGPEERLKDTRFTQPCLFVVNALHYYDALGKHGRPEAAAGHSLGEYNALLAAGAFDIVTGVRLVARRGELMASARNGAMLAILKFPFDRLLDILNHPDMAALDVANMNAPLQTVIAGPSEAITRAAAVFESQGAACVPLAVSAAFHSRYMAEAADQFAYFLDSFLFDPLAIPVIANVTGRPYPVNCSSSRIRSLLVQQITSPVRWADGIHYLDRMGVTSFQETGPGTTLTRLRRQLEHNNLVRV